VTVSGLYPHTVNLLPSEQKKLAEDAKEKGVHQEALIAQIVRQHYGVGE
jgi:hypothetical protein